LTPFGGTPIARHIVVHPGVQFKPIEGDALPADRNSGEIRSHLSVKTVPVHTEIAGHVPKTYEAR
jgi:hypothetical protein